MRTRKIHLVVIDPQNDFMDIPNKSALPVTGANADMDRLAAFIRMHGHRLEEIHVTLDSHQVVDIAHPAWWRDKNGKMVTPFTLIKADDIEAGIYVPRDPGQLKRSLDYARAGKSGQIHPLHLARTLPHRIVGTLCTGKSGLCPYRMVPHRIRYDRLRGKGIESLHRALRRTHGGSTGP